MGKRSVAFGRDRQVSRGDLTGTGKTVADAKKDLERRIDEALTGDYDPIIVNYNGCSCIVYRCQYGWVKKNLTTEKMTENGFVDTNYSCSYNSKDEAVQAAAYHVLSSGSKLDEFHKDEDIPAFLTDPRRRRDLLSTARFQRAYAWVMSNPTEGVTDLHRWACEHNNDPRFL